MKPVFKGTLLLVLLTLVACATYLWSPFTANQSLTAALAASAQYDVEIIRDEWGVPHIFGVTDWDTAFGLGYAQSEDDLENIQSVVAATRGRLARYQGKDAAAADYLVNLMGIWPLVDSRYQTLKPETRKVAEAYAAGVNLFAAEHPDIAWQGLYPLTGKDVIAGFVFKTPFFYGADKVFTNLFTGTGERTLAIAPVDQAKAFHLSTNHNLFEIGSNGIAVAPNRTTDGATRLIVNSHQPYKGPVAWYEVHLVSEQGLDMYGGTFPGGPVVFHGFNRHLGWANTVNNPDLIDVYQLSLNPDNENEYLLDGSYVKFETSTANIDVGLWGPFAYPAKEKVYRSVHGPVLKTEQGAFAIRYAGMNEVRHLEQYLALNKASNYQQWYDAMKILALPSINYIYADQTGNVGFVHNGQYPKRKPGWQWQDDLPGDRKDLIWQAYHDFSEVPQLINPPSGIVFNANNKPFSATNGEGNLSPESYPPEFGLQTNDTNRSLRLEELTAGGGLLSRADLLTIKFDKRYSHRSKAASTITRVLTHDWQGDERMERATEHLANWDFSTDIENRHAALGVLTAFGAAISKLDKDKAAIHAFEAAVELLEKNYHRIDPTWGEVNRIVRGKIDLPIAGGPDILRAVYPAKIREDGKLHASGGDTLIILAEWDKSGKVKGSTIHQFGSATLDQMSSHFADQTPLFAAEKFRPVLLDRDVIEQHGTRIYRPGKIVSQ